MGHRAGAVVAALGGCVVVAVGPSQAGVVFTDVTAGAGISMTYQPAPLLIPRAQEWTLGGVSIGDFNRDGWPDIFVMRGGQGPDRLYINNGNGTFTDQAAAWGVAQTHGGASCCVGDFDGDGWPDIYVTSFGTVANNQGQVGKNRLYRNNGNGTFTDVAVEAGVAFTGMIIPSGNGCAFGDYDLDGHLDLAVAAWSGTAEGNRLFRNNGNGTFTDVTGVAAVIPPATWGFQPAFADMDGDGYPELLFVGDFHTTAYFVNNRDGTFTNATQSAGVGIESFGMGQCIGDFNNDLKLDWYVTSIFQDFPNPGNFNGNTLYRQIGPHQYEEHAGPAGVKDGGWGWATQAVDIDHDGWLDLIEVNGRNAGEWLNEPEYIWRNNGNGTFTEVVQSPWSLFAGDARTLVLFDYDRDGDMDLVIIYNSNGPLKVYRNDTTPIGRWLQIGFNTMDNPRVPPFGRGTRVIAKTGAQSRLRYLDGGHGYGGSSEELIHFGLGNALVVDELVIEFQPGYTKTLFNVPTNQRLVVTPPNIADLDGDGVVGGADLALLLGSWGPVTDKPARLCDLNNDGVVNGADLAILLGEWTP
ncbi:MAG: VCBS repeat-containing protein [Phycisphaeraceae bacterium]|nr:VCBS repeat-containing protein [Phycisphaeraceae bacterium]